MDHQFRNRSINRRIAVQATGVALLVPAVMQSREVTAALADTMLVRMITHLNGLGDSGYNDLGNAGGERAAAELGVDFQVFESETAADYVPTTQESAIVANLTVGLGDLLHDAIEQTALEFTGRQFAILDSRVDLPNVRSYTFREQEGYFLAGVLAALTTQTGKVGVVGGIRVPPIMRSEVGFIAGVHSIDPSIEVLVGYLDSFEDATYAKELTLAHIRVGADVILPIAGRAGDGSYSAAAELSSIWIISADADKQLLSDELQLAVVHKHVDKAMFDAIELVVNGVFNGGAEERGLVDDGMQLGTYHESVTEDMRSTIESTRLSILDGTIRVPSTDNELAAFLAETPRRSVIRQEMHTR